ncbi:DUF803-domain-containing protein [Annulohypoxylon truncatum]|uniref:DUF803-domain-containing protein n=1 Tax=Annulohypoxylon truncatum TaxID=327061 RepID=UPI002007CE1A|nr:DUF803-domain-containing protein [Annulohypoxylon truncatum]KAI1213438.1 DUF803-domain-containing protein [Annulohypoxylon truncatum]
MSIESTGRININMSWAANNGTGSDPDDGADLGNWSSLIGIITAISGNVLIALALNVQRYSHIKLHQRRVEARERAREALRKARDGHRNGFGTTDIPDGIAQDNGDEAVDGAGIHPLSQSIQSVDSNLTEQTCNESKVNSSYLKSTSWWIGQVLMTVGEMGNFLAYGFAPASIVSPLGVVALISNCIIAPIFFGEKFRTRDFWGVVIAVGGAVTVVLSAKTEETKLDPHNVWDHITSMEFEIYMGITFFFIIVLMWASPRYGNRTILIDLGLVGLFGGYTALATKGVSSMLSSTLFKAFTTPVTYGMVFILLATAIMQVRYVNKALQRFDSTQVIPIQFVLFTLSVIIGSAVLYRDFERTTAQQAAKFIGGCLLTFFGVFLITSGRPRQDEEDELSDDENVEETIGLLEQERNSRYTDHDEQPGHEQLLPPTPPRPRSSRRSSYASRLNFINTSAKTVSYPQSRAPSIRRHDASATKTSHSTPVESSPLLDNPWRHSADDHPSHPELPLRSSAESVPTIYSVTSVAVSEPLQSNTSLPNPDVPPPSPDRPSTPRAHPSRPHSHHFSNAFISPSPLSSTVSAVVADALLRGEESPNGRRRSIRRTRPSIRSSLFVPQSEDNVNSVAEPLFEDYRDDDEPPYQDDPLPTDNKTLRGRARSLSSALGEFFGRKRRRRVSDPEPGPEDDNGYSDDTSRQD